MCMGELSVLGPPSSAAPRQDDGDGRGRHQPLQVHEGAGMLVSPMSANILDFTVATVRQGAICETVCWAMKGSVH